MIIEMVKMVMLYDGGLQAAGMLPLQVVAEPPAEEERLERRRGSGTTVVATRVSWWVVADFLRRER